MIHQAYFRLKDKRLFRFLIVGALAFVVDAGLLATMIYILNFNPYWQTVINGVELNISIANATSIILAYCFNFVLQRMWAFQARDQKWQQQAWKFIIVAVIAYILNNLIFGFLVKQLFINELISKVIVTALQMIWSFIMYKLIVFKVDHHEV